MPVHDVECSKCGAILRNYFASPWPSHLLHEDGGELIILWHSDSPRIAAVHPHDRTVVYQHPVTGQVIYPGRNDTPMPDRYRDRGFQRVEFEHASDLEKFEKEHHVRNEALWYNSGNEA